MFQFSQGCNTPRYTRRELSGKVDENESRPQLRTAGTTPRLQIDWRRSFGVIWSKREKDRIFRDIYDHLAKFFEVMETCRGLIATVMEIHLSIINN